MSWNILFIFLDGIPKKQVRNQTCCPNVQVFHNTDDIKLLLPIECWEGRLWSHECELSPISPISYTGTEFPFVNDFYEGFESFEYLFDKIRNFTRNENRFHFKAQKANDKCSPCIKVLSLHSKLFHLQLQWTLNEHPNLEFSFIRVVIFMGCDLFIV